jgi:hypothetical protein
MVRIHRLWGGTRRPFQNGHPTPLQELICPVVKGRRPCGVVDVAVRNEDHHALPSSGEEDPIRVNQI